MKLVTTVHGRASEVFLNDEVRPNANYYLPQVIDQVIERYAFLRRPDLSVAADKGIKFEHGRLISGRVAGEQITIDNLDIYSDGIIVVCRNTDDAESVLKDVFDWGIKTFGFREPKMPPKLTYTSWVVVDFETPAASLIAKFSEIRSLIASSYERLYGQKLDFQFERTAFSVDPSKVPQFTNTQYAIDRRGGAEYSMERYFCTAPLRTADHLELLQSIESRLSA